MKMIYDKETCVGHEIDASHRRSMSILPTFMAKDDHRRLFLAIPKSNPCVFSTKNDIPHKFKKLNYGKKTCVVRNRSL